MKGALSNTSSQANKFVRSFLKNDKWNIISPIEKSIASTKIESNSYIEAKKPVSKINISNAEDFINYKINNKRFNNYKFPCLPENVHDMKGVDQAVYKYVHRQSLLRNIPTLTSNKFFILKFIPATHHVSLFRKSYFSFMFSNKGGYALNDPELSRSLSAYCGRYKKHSFFRERLFPLDKSVVRSIYRKNTRKAMFYALRENIRTENDLRNAAGIYYFRFLAVPKLEEDYLKLSNYINDALKKVLDPKSTFYSDLRRIVMSQNKSNNIAWLERNVKRTNYIGNPRFIRYFPKLPFLRSKQS
ncbi:Piso0_005045 [Millerozyma farinosa CBS 7064]|uniref:Piso0_005045 protein n=1 Tax=Pichia sorbitophila (strain ATCC MYA-4447 / BCRC 22081 / CBS 7064 / NBRC 10061 / NRRL Y-12695) TaxID=559304 RepID=G8Y146_PICSO|nr:Piso0_005045 [Millerozyma farinosa CBS 7064]